jgi:glycosyltransferase involved in cell wall biosynthesis
MSVDYSLVIPAFNEESLLPATLASVQTAMAAVGAFAGEIVVVDNNSTDRTAEIARAAGAKVVFEPINQISRARNAGAAAASGRYLVFVDADTTIDANLLEAAITALHGGRICGGGAQVGSSDRTSLSARIGLGLWNLTSPLLGYAAGAFIYCRRDAWEQIGGFSHELYAAEEIVFSRMLRRWGRHHQMRFKVLPLAIDTSMRKIHWYGPLKVLAMTLPLVITPWRLKSRRHCAVWYERPARPGASGRSAAAPGTAPKEPDR